MVFTTEAEYHAWFDAQAKLACHQIIEMVPMIYPTNLIGTYQVGCACPKVDPTKPMPQVIYWGGYCPLHSVRSM